MGEEGIGIFPAEDALEMVLMFDGTGRILYANAAACDIFRTSKT